MKPLIQISTVPIEYELKLNHARLEYRRTTTNLEIQRDKKGMRIKSQPVRLHLDMFEARNSISPSAMRSIEEAAQKGKSVAYNVTGRYAQEGQILLKAQVSGDGLDQIIAGRNQLPTGDFTIAFTPSDRPEISWTKPDIMIQYEMDKLNFDWKVNEGGFEFIPPNIELSILQYPDVKIEYIGDPIYVPPSASPNYRPFEARA